MHDDIEDYVVLRIENLPTKKPSGGLSGLRAPVGEVFDLASATDRPRIVSETAKLTPNQAQEAAADPRNTLSRAFPVTQIVMQSSEPASAAAVAAAAAAGHGWGIPAVGADAGHLDGKAAEVVVAVLDSGIDHKHEAFRGMELVTENFAGGSATDVSGHGTHCASLIFGRSVNGVRIGVAPAIRKALVAKVFDDHGASSTGCIVNALAWAYENGANIASMSLSFDFEAMFRRLKTADWEEPAAIWETLVRYREAANQLQLQIDILTHKSETWPGTLIVAAAGNQSRRAAVKPYSVRAGVPASISGVIPVGAAGQEQGGWIIPPFSNIDPFVLGPGTEIVGAKPGGGLVAMDGTSAACPYAAGVAALWWDHTVRDMADFTTAEEVAINLRTSALKLPVIKPNMQGRGLVQAPPAATPAR
ncbi:S8 family serine peptidase [Phreatobacter stygius]|uniref:Peptidase S8 n=1 Tax=Phreatobacter stygius TaxID=1940610 RepID=A0A4D7BCY4_9HYPH|nr:S8 family serine peptidase [Phreatobacter stygius]QCI68545.1 peptidase S8 [Phreatobacter stygius]